MPLECTHGPSNDPAVQHRRPGGVARPTPLGAPAHRHPRVDPPAADPRGPRSTTRWRSAGGLDRPGPGHLSGRADRHSRDPAAGAVSAQAWLCAAPADVDRTASGPARPGVRVKKRRAEALLVSPPPRADVYVEDESELAMLPTLTRCWTRRGHQRKIPAPGKNRKRHLFAAVDWRDGTALRRYADHRESRTLCALADAVVWRFRRRGRRALIVLDNAGIHRPDTSRHVAALLERHGPWVTLVYLPAYSPELQPLDRLFRVWRGEVTHNHRRTTLDQLETDCETFFHRRARRPERILRMIGSPFSNRTTRRRVHVA